MYKIGITGSRTFTDKTKLIIILKKQLHEHPNLHPGNTLFMSGVAKGPDTIISNYLGLLGFTVIYFKEPYQYYPKMYQNLPQQWRNVVYYAKDMNTVDNCTRLWTFWDGESKGTKATFKYAYHKGIPVIHLIENFKYTHTLTLI